MMNQATLLVGAIAIVAAGAAATSSAHARKATPFRLQSAEANEHYQRGRQALDRGDWDAALEAFEEAAEDEALEDAALYWQAYALSKAGDAGGALERIEELESRHPSSRWRDDARALAVEIRGVSGTRAVATRSGEDDIKLMALNGLMHAGEEEALPILEEFLAGEHSTRLKERALFILAQSGSARAHEVLAEAARGERDVELQKKAIRYLGVHSSEGNVALLAELYGSLADRGARRAVLSSFMVAGERERLLAVARTERDVGLRRHAVRQLGAMGASNELWEMFQNESSVEVKKGILQALMVAGSSERLFSVARSRNEPEELRLAAVRLLGVTGGHEQLWELYRDEPSIEVKKRILHGLFLADQEERLAAVARDASEPEELRKAAIHNLGISGDEARPVLLEIYGAEAFLELKERVLHALFLQGADAELIDIARRETSPELKRKAVHWLSLMGTEAARDYLMELLRQ